MQQQAYDANDLAFFQKVLNDAELQVAAFGGPAPELGERAIKERMATAIFRSVATGERDPEALKLEAIAAVVDNGVLSVIRKRA